MHRCLVSCLPLRGLQLGSAFASQPLRLLLDDVPFASTGVVAYSSGANG